MDVVQNVSIWEMSGNMNDKVTALYDLSWSYRAARVLYVANKLDIFTALAEEQMTLEQLCHKCHTKPDTTEKLLIACTAMGLLKKQGGRYKNTELAKTYLLRGRKLYQGDIIAHSESVCDLWDSFENEICSEPLPETTQASEHRNFIMGMHNIAVAGHAGIFIKSIDLTGRRKLLDVGGGPGTYSIAACKRYPQLRAVVFDIPETVSITKEVIAAEGMQDKVSIRQGNWDTDTFGEGYDVVLLSNVLHGPASEAEMKLNKAYDSMVGAGLLVIQDFLLNDEKTGPLIPALFNIMVGAYSICELLRITKEAGFVRAAVVVSSQQIGSAWITAEKPAVPSTGPRISP